MHGGLVDAPTMKVSRSGAAALCALYGALALAFCASLLLQPLPVSGDWPRHSFYYASVLRSLSTFRQLPYWNPWYCGGNVLWQNPQVALLSPVYPMAAASSLAAALKASIVLHYWIGLLGMHLLLRRVIGLTFLPALVYLSSVFMLSGGLAAHVGEGRSVFLTAVYGPFFLFLFLRALQTGRVRDLLFAGAVIALLIFGGGVELVPASLVVVSAVAIGVAVSRRQWQPIVAAGVVIATGLALAAPKLVPLRLFLSTPGVADVRAIAQHSFRTTTDVLVRAYVDSDAWRRLEPFEYGSYIGWPATLLALASVIWVIRKAQGPDRWFGLSLVFSFVVLILCAAGEFSPLAPAVLLRSLPLFDRFGFPGRYTLFVPLCAAMLIAWALQSVGVAVAARGVKVLAAAFCAAATLQLLFVNRVAPGRGAEVPSAPVQLFEAENIPGARSLSNCDDSFRLPHTARSDQVVIVTDEHSRSFGIGFSPNRISARVMVDAQPARVILNQNFDAGWFSNAGPVTEDAGTHRPSVLLPAGFTGLVDFHYLPRGVRTGLTVFAAAIALGFLCWGNRIGPLDELPHALVPYWAAARARMMRLDPGVVVFLFIVLVLDAHIYLSHPSRPTALTGGWEHFWDQSQYLRSAQALARLDFRPQEHWYPIGYALLAVPFVHLARDPFAFVNALSLLTFAAAFLLYFRPIIGYGAGAISFLVALASPVLITTPMLTSFPLWSQFVVPWNTTPIAALYMCVLCLVRAVGSPHRVRTDFALGLLCGLIVIIKPTDGIPLVIVAAWFLWSVHRDDRFGMRTGAAIAGAMVLVIPFVALAAAKYGGLSGPYVQEARRIGMSLSDLHERAYSVLVDAGMTFGEPQTALLQLQPWLYVLIPLAVVWAANDTKRGLLPVALAGGSLITYLAFNDFWPFNLLRYSLIHYIVWTLPVLTAAGVAGAWVVWRESRWAAAITVGAIAAALACYRVEPRDVTPDVIEIDAQPSGGLTYTIGFDRPQDIDAIELAGAYSNDRVGLTRSPVDMVADRAAVEVYRGYRVIQLNGGIRVIFNRHMSARRIQFRMPANIEHLPDRPRQVRAIRFGGRFAPFWSPRAVAHIDP